MARTLSGFAWRDEKTVSGIPDRRAAQASPWPKFPADPVTHPGVPAGRPRSRATASGPRRAPNQQAPRALKLRIGFTHSTLTLTRQPAATPSGAEANSGVSRNSRGIAARAASIPAGVGSDGTAGDGKARAARATVEYTSAPVRESVPRRRQAGHSSGG